MTGELHADGNSPGDLPFLERLIGQFTSLSKDIFIYGLSGSLGQVFSLITVPILTRLLTVDEFGTLDIIYATLGYFAILMGLNIGSGLWRYYYEVPEEDIKDRQQMVSSLLWFVLVIGVPVAVAIAVFGPEISVFLFKKPDHAAAIQLAVFALPIMAIYNLFIGLQRLKRRPKNYLLINVGYSLLYFLLILVFIIGFRKGIPGIFLAQLIAYSCGALATLWLSRDLLAFTFSKKWFFKMAAYGLPLLPAAFLNWSLAAVNRYFLNAHVGVVQVGYYSLASKITLAMTLVVSSFTLAWQPFMLANLEKPEAPKLYTISLNYFVMITLLFGAGLAVFARELVLLIATPAYLPGAALVSLLVLRQILPGVDYITGIGIVVSKKTIFTSLALGAGVLANLASNLLLTARLGIYGAAISELVGVLTNSALVVIISNRLYPISWNKKIITQALLGFLICVSVSMLILRMDLPFQWTSLIRLSLITAYAFYLFTIIDKGQRNVILELSSQFIRHGLKRLHLLVE